MLVCGNRCLSVFSATLHLVPASCIHCCMEALPCSEILCNTHILYTTTFDRQTFRFWILSIRTWNCIFCCTDPLPPVPPPPVSHTSYSLASIFKLVTEPEMDTKPENRIYQLYNIQCTHWGIRKPDNAVSSRDLATLYNPYQNLTLTLPSPLPSPMLPTSTHTITVKATVYF